MAHGVSIRTPHACLNCDHEPLRRFDDLVAARATECPADIAVSEGRRRLDYATLAARADEVADRLRRMGVAPGDVVAVHADRGIAMVTAMLAAWRAGAVYLPLETGQPKARLEAILADAEAAVVVTTPDLLERCPGAAAPLVLDPDALPGPVDAAPVTGAVEDGSLDDVAYVIYTSGSTGTPKGVAVTHRSLANQVRWRRHDDVHLFGGDPTGNGSDRPLRVAFSASIAFDASFDQLGYLAAGAHLVAIPPEDARDPARLIERLQDVDVFGCTPSLLPSLLEAGFAERVTGLRLMLVGGEAVSPSLWSACRSLPYPVLNLYGPTECTVDTTGAVVQDYAEPTIGTAVAGAELHVLSPSLEPVAGGAPGELWVAGPGLAHGYLKRPALTADRFRPHPTPAAPGQRVYRTGDVVRRRPDGSFDYIGRTDDQVKLRGFRVELGEVEAAIDACVSPAAVVVTLRTDGPAGPALVAYVVPGAEPFDEGRARAELRRRLPEHMVPSHFVTLAELPLARSGKVDRVALPPPPVDTAGPAGREARTPTEAVVAEAWAAVLGRRHVGADDDFFDMGGHSLVAARLVARLRDALGRDDLRVTDVFAHPTVARLAQHVDEHAGEAADVIEPADRAGALPTSFAQERTWFLDQLHPDNIAYTSQQAIHLRGPLDVAVLTAALQEVVRRHESLRTTFADDGGTPRQVVHEPWVVSLPVVDLSSVPEAERDERERAMFLAQARQPYDLRRLPLVRWTLVRMAQNEHVLHQIEHHVVHDGWSVGVLMGELSALYRAFRAGEPSPLEELRVQFADYAAWQRRRMETEAMKRSVAHWVERLDGAPKLALASDFPVAKERSHEGAAVRRMLPADLTAKLFALAAAERVTPFTVLFTAFSMLLQRHTGVSDLVVGTGVANRTTRDVERLIGMVINTVVLRADASGDPTLRDLVRRVHEATSDAFRHADVPFEAVVKAARPERSAGANPLFDVAFSFHNADVPKLRMGEVEGTIEYRQNGSAKMDLNVIVAFRSDEAVDGVVPADMTWEYATDRFAPATVERLVDQFVLLLHALAEPDLDRRASDVSLLDSADADCVLREWNDTAAALPDQTIVDLIAQATAAAPASTAVVDDGGVLSYGELDARARAVAARLRAAGAGRGSIVAVCAPRGRDLVVGLLGVWLSGAAYLPVDPELPSARVELMLADSKAVAILCTSATDSVVPPTGIPTLLVDATAAGVDGDAPTATPPKADDLAYVIYTSGSTGKPKAVAVAHHSLANVLAWHRHAYGLGAADRASQLASPAFDASMLEIWSVLALGATVEVVPPDVRSDAEALAQWLAARGVTTVVAASPLAEPMFGAAWPATAPVRSLLTGGERLHTAPPVGTPFEVVNHYGPTETTVVATAGRVEAGEAGLPSIGIPITNTSAYVLDGFGNPLPAGVPGELCVAGAGVAWGYLGRSALTAERFVPNPFGPPGSRLYRSGDRAMWSDDGRLHFLGRFDHQVKLRGFRIELGEVEAALSAVPGIAQAVVDVRPVGRERALVAYVVVEPAASVDADGVKQELRRTLPEHMVPAVVVGVDALPVGPNDKVDRAALPDPVRPIAADGAAVLRTDTERLVARIWADHLGVEAVGPHDDFFELGGHSLLAAKAIAAIRTASDRPARLAALFDAPTVAGLAAHIDGLDTTAADDDGRGDDDGLDDYLRGTTAGAAR